MLRVFTKEKIMFEKITILINKIKQQKPLVLNITNDVTMDFVANGLLCLGASPVMSKAEEEMEDLINIASVVVINLGTLDEKFIVLCKQACMIANRLKKPIILDPVGAGATMYRTETSITLINQYSIAIIRGNASEIITLSGAAAITKGVDSTAESTTAIESARRLAKKQASTIVVSGETDVIVQGDHVALFKRGTALMPMITGTGCLLSAVVGAFHAVEPDPYLAATFAAVFYGVCGEMAADHARGPGSFKPHFLDALSAMPERAWYEEK
jgi:hydroxyethylthiazole kinase